MQSVQQQTGALHLQHDVVTSFPGGSVKVNAPVVAKGPAKAPAPLVDVKFPTGGVTVGSDGVHVDWGNGAGAVNVGGRKLLRGSSVASTIPAAAPVSVINEYSRIPSWNATTDLDCSPVEPASH